MANEIEIWDMVGAYPTCGNCGSTHVVRDAWAEWSVAAGDWILKTVFDDFACDRCGEPNKPVWKLDKDFRTKRIARLNDATRHGELEHATVVVTSGVRAWGEDFLRKAAHAVIAFDDFTEDNDPHGERDFGGVEVDGQKLFWKIDTFDPKLERHSLDAANPNITHRVLTIMLASEY
ncbi:DUF3768 domain-containing protein [Shimia aestuarii]|uniref:DUF3768 domain-containing protein n=1 Tax=Shimia aestuarii TaxID=254406 RepID=A0A1I4T826_9RHOB|nr:DUF3768 domain-containing protein [Shimia aestuarii]SFM72805.1 Protein of unknown function [Shimia aestuarii]